LCATHWPRWASIPTASATSISTRCPTGLTAIRGMRKKQSHKFEGCKQTAMSLLGWDEPFADGWKHAASPPATHPPRCKRKHSPQGTLSGPRKIRSCRDRATGRTPLLVIDLQQAALSRAANKLRSREAEN